MDALIVEDEVTAQKHLKQVLKEAGDITVIAVTDSISETIEWLENNSMPDIMFLDIHLADGIAFEIFNHLKITCPVVFTTAYDEYALKAFKVNSIDYLLKPVEPEDVKNALKKLGSLTESSFAKTLSGLASAFGKQSKYKSSFLIPVKGDKLVPLQASEIACFFIDAGTVKALTSEGRTFRFDSTLDDIMDVLDPAFFYRANRQFIISRSAVKDIDLWFNSRLSVNLKVNVSEKILISKARISEFKKWFGS
ncbi:MAG TPA: LytTR family DNA-binding domain-containing protein [Bacteroidales bacterium]|nr:LytTR family DNA-binding domain-containing protein [Bacteroidales bacterium]